MNRLKYIYIKILYSIKNKTLFQKILRKIFTKCFVNIEVIIGYLFVTKIKKSIDFKLGFKSHINKKELEKYDHKLLNSIVNAYKISKLHQSKIDDNLLIKGLWKEWIDVNYKKLMVLLSGNNNLVLSDTLNNLFREPFTIGTGGYDNYRMYNSIFGKLYIKYVWHKYYNYIKDLNYSLEDIEFPNVGNPTGVSTKNGIISIDTLRHAYFSIQIKNLLADIKNPVCVEIGAGLGGQAFQIISMISEKKIKYIIFDIPEVLVLSSYFLMKAFPNKKIKLFDGNKNFKILDAQYDIELYPYFMFEHIPNDSIDLFFNSCSFSEMDEHHVKIYLKIIERTCKKYFFHDNHDTNFKFINSDGSISKNLIGSKIVPDLSKFKIVYKKPRIHGLPEDRYDKSFEYLFESIK